MVSSNRSDDTSISANNDDENIVPSSTSRGTSGSCSNNSNSSSSSSNNGEASSSIAMEDDRGSTVPEAIFNFTNCIVGAGVIGLGGAIASSGGFISIILICFFAVVTKLSLDLLIRLSRSSSMERSTTRSYEDLAHNSLGYWKGRVVVMVCKFSYSFGCLVAYVIVIKDNCGPALISLLYDNNDNGDDTTTNNNNNIISDWVEWFLSTNYMVTWFVSSIFILPLCLLRNMTKMAFVSLISVASMVTIVGIVIYIYFECPDVRQESDGSFYNNWVEIQAGVLGNLGTFVFTFVSQHTVHLVFSSLKPSLRNAKNWKVVSSCSIIAASTVSLLVGIFVYITFWKNTKSDIFSMYPSGWMIDTAKLLLSLTMIFTFPLPFFACRELLILILIHPFCAVAADHRTSIEFQDDTSRGNEHEHDHGNTDSISTVEDRNDHDHDNIDDNLGELERPLLPTETTTITTNPIHNDDNVDIDNAIDTLLAVDTGISTAIATSSFAMKNWLLTNDDRQLCLPGHVTITVQLWLIVTGLAIAAPNLGDVLDFVGCASGTIIAFVIPAVLSFHIEGYNHLAMFIFIVGGVVGIVGTYYSIKQLMKDI